MIFPSVYVLYKSASFYGPQMLLALVIPLGFTIFASIACIDIKRYGQEIIHLLSGNFLIESGCVVKKAKNIYTIRPIVSKKKQTKFEHFSYPNFYIKDRNCERAFQVGDSIEIIYPCSPKLSTRTTHQLYAIYACSIGEPYLQDTQKAMANRRKTVFAYLSVVTLLSVALLCILFVSINALLKQTFF